jgi:hypothetical protein
MARRQLLGFFATRRWTQSLFAHPPTANERPDGFESVHLGEDLVERLLAFEPEPIADTLSGLARESGH